MGRSVAIAILFAAPLLAQPASAQDCLCLVGDAFGLALPETPDTTIESTAPAAHAGPSADPHRSVLWCASANDPRCQPMQPSDVPTPSALASGSVGALVAALRRTHGRFASEMTMTPALGLAPSCGVTSALDRPPRA